MSKLSLSFRITYNGQLVREEKLSASVLKIGKVPSAHLQLADETVSRMHAIIEVLGNDISLIDLGSTRGTFVNGVRINKTKLQSGDVITVGDTQLELTVDAPATAVVATMPTITQTAPPPIPMAARAPVVAAPAPMMMQSTEELGSAQAIEVATMLGDSVVNVKHCMDPKSGKVTPKTWGFAAAGLACLLTSGIAFATSVAESARNKGALDYWTHVQKRPAHAFRPVTSGPGLDYLAFGGLAFGLLGVTAGLVRARREKKSPFYRIGTAPGVETALETAPSPDFPMVAPQGDEFVFNFGQGMDGEMTVNGQSTPLSQLASRPSESAPGAQQITIPASARIRVRSGQTTFLVSSVAKPKETPVPLFSAMNGKHLKYVAGSLAAHLGLVLFLSTIPTADAGINVNLTNEEQISLKGDNTQKDDVPPEQDPDKNNGDSGGADSQGATMELPEGKAGDPKEERVSGQMQVKDNKKPHAMSREEAIAQARDSGWLGDTSHVVDSIKVLGAQQDWSSGFDGANRYGTTIGADGAGKGTFGGGVHDWGGPGGGCAFPPCGIIGTGRYGTIGNGDKVGDNWKGPGRGNGGTRDHIATTPEPVLGRPTSEGDLDKAIIKRYIKRSIDQIGYCYEKQLLANPNQGGEVLVSFYIAPNGTVQSAAGKGFSTTVSSCVANVISNISFPKPKNGGGVQVNYPFNFRPTGSW
ncbi:MAG: AgmX/PglI C-terminal domain-containing protein [Deltaproteobacteria bacterium]|nr:AgmX/PglI C-terminal domain-containing protein [Deltaproteobacteria bacterium]